MDWNLVSKFSSCFLNDSTSGVTIARGDGDILDRRTGVSMDDEVDDRFSRKSNADMEGGGLRIVFSNGLRVFIVDSGGSFTVELSFIEIYKGGPSMRR